jgi:hypothetical protein
MSQNREVLFHARFPKSGFVSHFKGIGRKRETNGHFRKVLPLKEPPKTMKRGRRKPKVFVLPKTVLVSGRFTFRFIPDDPSVTITHDE